MAFNNYIEELKSELHGEIEKAFSNGMSVIEISNLIRRFNIEFVHGALRDAKVIPKMPRTGKRHLCDIDPRLQQGLRARGYSFARWCLAWKFDPNEAAAALKKQPLGEMNAVHDAVRRDFPDVYMEIFAGKVHSVKLTEKRMPPRLSLHIIWDEVRNTYVASIPETPGGVEVTGYNWDNALQNMLAVQRLRWQIAVLREIFMKPDP